MSNDSSILGVILFLVALCGFADGIAQGALFGEAARLKSAEITQALVCGTAVSGVAVCFLRVLTKASLPDTPEGLQKSANIYFSIAGIVCISCVVLYVYVLPTLPMIQALKQADLRAALDEDFGTVKPLRTLHTTTHMHSSITSDTILEQQQQQIDLEDDSLLENGMPSSSTLIQPITAKEVFVRIKDLAFVVAFIYV